MKPKPDLQPLLDAVCDETASGDFRARLLNQTLRQVRRRKQVRRWTRGTLVITLLLVFGLIGWQTFRIPLPSNPPSNPSIAVTHSYPLSPNRIVRTQPGSVQTISSSPQGFSAVETDPSVPLFKSIDDQELFRLLASRPAILVRHGPHQAELLLLD